VSLSRNGSYDLLLVDHDMPVKSGIEVIRELAETADLLPAIMVTGAGSESVAVEAMKLGAYDYVIKDGEARFLELIPSAIEKAVASRRLREENEAAAEALRNSEARFRTVFQESTEVLLVIDGRSRNIVYANLAVERVLGYDPDAILGKHFSFLYPAENLSREELLEQLDVRDGVFTAQTVIRADGSTLPMDLAVKMIPWGGDTALLASFRDVSARLTEEQAMRRANEILEAVVEERTAELVKANRQLEEENLQRKKAEEELQKQHQFLITVLESLTHPFYVIDAEDYSIIMANSASGTAVDEERTTCYALAHDQTKPCSSQDHPCPLNRVKQSKKPVSVSHIHYDADGEPRNVEVHAYPIFDDNGEVIQVIEYCPDVTERVRAEEEVIRNNRLLEALSKAQSLFISTDSLQGPFTELLEALLTLSGSECGVMGEVSFGVDGKPSFIPQALLQYGPAGIGQTCDEELAEQLTDFERGDSPLRAIIHNAGPVILPGSSGGKLPDDAVRPSTDLQSFLGLPLMAGQEVVGVVGIANGNSDYDEVLIHFLKPFLSTAAGIIQAFRSRRYREAAEEALRESEERFRTIVDSAGDCIFIKNTDGRYTLVNPAMSYFLGMEPLAILGKTDTEIFGGEAGKHLEEVDARVLNGDRIEEEHTRSVQGERLTFLDTRVPMVRRGEVIGICGISRNITDRKRDDVVAPGVTGEYESHAMRSTLESARLAAKTDSLILLTGESGAGKDYLAKYIHEHSLRANGPFFSINCASVAAELAESELFGHEAGAFTGANRRKRGLLELAEGGTLLLNEIGELSLRLQAKLLTFLDTRTFTRVGGERKIGVNARLIAATNRNLEQETEEGRFRKDLFYRLNVYAIEVPPLRERKQDIPLLADRLIAGIAGDLQLGSVPKIHAEFAEALTRYDWPGNVRELKNVLERAVIISRGGPLKLELPELQKARHDEWHWKASFPPSPSLNDAVKEMRSAFIMEALERASGKKTEAAKLLGLTYDGIKKQIKTLGIVGSDRPR
jgi:PAS domain S-box-containing protein